MHQSITKVGKVAAVFVFLGGCGYVDKYEEQVYDLEPVYCYQTLADVQCYKEPNHVDKNRIVNYYGPHPTRYDEPEKPEVPELSAPKPIDHWVKDPEPVVKPFVKMFIKPAAVIKSPGAEKSPLPEGFSPEEAAELRDMRITEPLPPITVEDASGGKLKN